MARGLKPSSMLKIQHTQNCWLNFNMVLAMCHSHQSKQDNNMKVYEVTSAIQKPLTPDQARIKSMKDQVKNTQKAIKAEKARQKIKAGQTALSQAIYSR
jgi:hypothetical protein